MPTSAIDSVIFRDIFGSPAMREVWSDRFRTQKYLDWEAALARAEAKVGLIPREAADEITRVCKVENIDFDAYAKETVAIGYPVLGLVHQAGQPFEARPQTIGDGAPFCVGGLRGLLREGGADGGRHHRPLRGTNVGQRIAHEVHATALPGRG